LRIYELLGAVAFAVALVALTAWSWHRHPVVRSALLIAAVGLVAALLTIARLPLQFRAPSPYRTMVVRVAGWFAWYAVLLGASRVLSTWWGRRSLPRTARAVAIVGAAALLVCAITTGLRRSSSYFRNPDDGPAIAALSAQTRAKVGRGPYRLDDRGAPAFYSPAPGVMWDLVRDGIDVRVDPRDRYIGKVHGAHQGMPALVLQFGLNGTPPDPSMVEVAKYRAASVADMREVRRLRAAALRLLRRDGMPEVLPVGLQFAIEQPGTQPGRAVNDYRKRDLTLEQLVDGDTLRALVFDHFVDTNAAYVKPLTEYKDLEDRLRQEDFTVYAARSALRSR
jgi:hypothetical protein